LHLYEKTNDSKYLNYSKERIDKVINSYPRISRAVVHKPGRDRYIWNEVTAMFSPSTACLGRVLDNNDYIKEAANQITTTKRLNKTDSGLWYHAGNAKDNSPVVWGRGMGWAILGLCDTLEEIPNNNKYKTILISILKEMLNPIMKVQDKSGFWRNILDFPSSRPESSCTCFIVYAFAKALNEGWIKSKKCQDMVLKGWDSIKGIFIYDNNLLSVCQSTCAGKSFNYYFSRPHREFIVGPAVLAGIEILKLKNLSKGG
jgi:unsaturated rhamnogalacturonyl hydrolase